MEQELRVGIVGKRELTVTAELTAAACGSGLLPVFATPQMIAMMEQTAAESVAPYLPEGSSTVGTHLDVRHLAATPVGLAVTCETELVEIDRRRLVFSCRAYDSAGLIGEGVQERFIVNSESFLRKTEAKRGE
ncbi:MAG: thioesterase family protein [Clostridia bacterium]|nr:thioesterase family protein [Clostridia bacterium]